MKSEFFPLSLIVLILFSCTVAAFAQNHPTEHKAPDFNVASGDDQHLSADALKGKIAVLFYEAKDVVEKNRALKNVLNTFFREQPLSVQQGVRRIAVINCTSAAWPLTGIWKKNLREKSREEKITIYGDWDGQMLAAYGMKGDDSNLVIIDKRGIVRFFRSGAIPPETIREIKALLANM